MRWSIAFAAVLAAALLAPAGAQAQAKCTAEGFVLTPDGEPIPNVQVLLRYKGHQPQNYRTKTDDAGHYVHVNVWEGIYDLTFTPEGEEEGVTVNDYPVRDIVTPAKPPVFRIGSRPSSAPPPGEGEAAETEAQGPTPEEQAAALAAQLDAGNAALAAGDVDGAIAAYEEVLAAGPGSSPGPPQPGPGLQPQGGVGAGGRGVPQGGGARSRLRRAPRGPRGYARQRRPPGRGHRRARARRWSWTPTTSSISTTWPSSTGIRGSPARRKRPSWPSRRWTPTTPRSSTTWATTLLGLGRMDDAIARLEKYLEVAPEDAPNRGPAQGMIEALKTQADRIS